MKIYGVGAAEGIGIGIAGVVKGYKKNRFGY